MTEPVRTKPCPSCGETGKVLVGFRFPRERTKTCTHCGGRGVVPDNTSASATSPAENPTLTLTTGQTSAL